MLVGAGAIFLCLYLAYFLQTSTHVPSPAWSWDFSTGMVVVGSGNSTRQGWQLTLNGRGQGVVVLPVPSLDASLHPLLRLQFSRQPAPNSLGVFWRTVQTGEQMAQYWIPGSLEKQFWLPMGGMSAWAGELVELAVLIHGAPGDEFVIEAIELLPGSPVNQLRGHFSDWNSFIPWGLTSINYYEATRSAGVTLYPVPLIATFFAASLFAYGMSLLFLAGIRFDWRVVSCIFILCWISLDLSWQGKLWRQLGLTYAQFSGRESDEKLLGGPDSALVQFMSGVTQRITSLNARVFVASQDDYTGMRGSYYLYPLNVFWQRSGSELPAVRYIHSGDYIVLINPTAIRFDSQKGTLLTPDREQISVKLLGEGGVGSLYRVI